MTKLEHETERVTMGHVPGAKASQHESLTALVAAAKAAGVEIKTFPTKSRNEHKRAGVCPRGTYGKGGWI